MELRKAIKSRSSHYAAAITNLGSSTGHICDFASLENLIARVERSYQAVAQYRAPSLSEQSIFPDLAYRLPRKAAKARLLSLLQELWKPSRRLINAPVNEFGVARIELRLPRSPPPPRRTRLPHLLPRNLPLRPPLPPRPARI